MLKPHEKVTVQLNIPVALALSDIVATLLANAKVIPEGKPEVEADIDPVQIGVAVYFIYVIAVVPVTHQQLVSFLVKCIVSLLVLSQMLIYLLYQITVS